VRNVLNADFRLATIMFGFQIKAIDDELKYDGPYGQLSSYEPPPTGEQLYERGLVAPTTDPYRYFSRDEIVVANFLRSRGLPILSVNTNDAYNTADAVTAQGTIAAVEIKSQSRPVVTTTVAHLRKAAVQSRNVVIHNKGGMTTSEARAAITKGLAESGHHLDNIIIMLDGGRCVHWAKRT